MSKGLRPEDDFRRLRKGALPGVYAMPDPDVREVLHSKKSR